MIRTGIQLPEFTRVIWASESAREAWQAKVQKVSAYILEMERAQVLKGRVAVQYVSDLQEAHAWAASHNLVLVVLEVLKNTTRVAFCPVERAGHFSIAWRQQDQDEIGNMLCYPRCCVRFFKEVWNDHKYRDTTWPMACSLANTGATDIYVDSESPWQSNILLRWMGVRAVFHLPCSFHCQRTVLTAEGHLDKTREEYEWLKEMLNWPMEWTAYHGVGIIKTPVFTVSTNTDHSEMKYTVRRGGSSYPSTGARGLVFPFRSGSEQEPSQWQDNGFRTLEHMEKAHREIVKEIPIDLDVTSVHDLGCGNGILLDKVAKRLAKPVALFGISHVKTMWRSTGTFHQMLIEEYHPEPRHPSLALISDQRFDENEMNRICAKQFTYVLVYNYENWTFQLRKGNDL